jgi:hypothetical protein
MVQISAVVELNLYIPENFTKILCKNRNVPEFKYFHYIKKLLIIYQPIDQVKNDIQIATR